MFYTPPPGGGGVGTLQTVTDAGNVTTNNIFSNNPGGLGIVAGTNANIGVSLQINAFNNGGVLINKPTATTQSNLTADGFGFSDTSRAGTNGLLTFDVANINNGQSITWSLPYTNGNTANHVLAPYTDPNGNLNYAGFYINNGLSVYGSLAFDGVEGALELVNGAGFGSNLKTLATAARVQTLPDDDGTLAIKKFDEYNASLEQTSGGAPTVQGDEISTNAALTTTFSRLSTGTYKIILNLTTTKIFVNANSCASNLTGTPYFVIAQKINATEISFTVYDVVGVPTDDWQYLNVTIKYTI